MSKRLTTIFFIGLLCLLCLFTVKNIFKGQYYTNHDGYGHIARIYQYTQAIKDGQFPPRWAGTLNGQFGSPIFVFSYPLPYMIGSLFYFSGLSLTLSFKVLIAISFIVSGIGAYLALSQLYIPLAAFCGAAFYVLAPYWFLNIYVRGSLSESIAYAILPFVFFAIIKLFNKQTPKHVAFVAIVIALFLLSQYLVAAIMLPVIFGFIIILFLQTKSYRFLRHILFAVIVGFSSAAFMYVPIFFEKKYTQFSQLVSFYEGHFVQPFQLIRSPWGYGFSLPGAYDEMSFQIGLIHIFIAGIGIVLLWKKTLINKKREKNNTLKQKLVYGAYFFVLVSIFLMIDTEPTQIVWRLLRISTVIDLPWRFLGLVTVAISSIASFVVEEMRFRKLFAFFLIIMLLYANRNHIRVNKYISYPDEEFAYYHGTATYMGEYTPYWHKTTQFSGFDKRWEVINGNLDITELSNASNHLSLFVNANEVSILRLNIAYFPGWTLYIDEHQIQKGTDFYITRLTDKTVTTPDETGLIELVILPGRHILSVRFEETNVRKSGNVLSLASFGVIGMLIVWPRKKNNATFQ